MHVAVTGRASGRVTSRALAGALSTRRQGRHLVAAAATSILFSVVGYHTLHGQTTRFISYIVMCVCFLFVFSLFVCRERLQPRTSTFTLSHNCTTVPKKDKIGTFYQLQPSNMYYM